MEDSNFKINNKSLIKFCKKLFIIDIKQYILMKKIIEERFKARQIIMPYIRGMIKFISL
jgi:hypothetical protein